MANQEVGDLTAASTPLAGTELVHIVQSGNSRKATVDEILAGTGGGSHKWDWAYLDSANRSSDWTQLATWTHSTNVSQVAFTSLSGAYTDILVVYTGLQTSASANFQLSVSPSNGSIYASNATIGQIISPGTASGAVMLFGYAETKTAVLYRGFFTRSGFAHSDTGAGFDKPNSDSTPINAIRFQVSTGNLTAGTITVYGI